jgi:serine/arginine repetitive matrix protein 2
MDPSAASAAAQAFLKNRASNASLSSAAAAAALKARPTTPTSVADVQTKRTLRRTGSTSSMGSSTGSARGPPGSQLERRLSSGSMSERTFRASSPAQAQHVPSAVDAPPVPAIPNNVLQQGRPPVPSKSHRRAAGVEQKRVASPPPNQASGRGSSLGPGVSSPPRRGGQRVTSLSSVQELTGLERPASRGSVNSINFSYPRATSPMSPMSPFGQRRLTSPSPQRVRPRMQVPDVPPGQDLIYDPNTRTFLTLAKIREIERHIDSLSSQPVKKKKRVAPKPTEGTYLAHGTVGGRPRGTAIDAMEAAASQQQIPAEPTPAPATAPEMVYELPTAPESDVPEPTLGVPKKKKKRRVVVASDSDSDQASYIPNSSDNDSDISFRPATFNTRAGTGLAKKPSIVREDREREEEEDDTPTKPKASETLPRLDTNPAIARAISPTPLPHSQAGRGHGRGQALASAAFAEGRQHTRSASQPAPTLADLPTAITGVGLVSKDSIRANRVQSVSPARTTHFATTSDNLVVKHQPPPRSISPRKSALKHSHSNSPRGPSPSGEIPSEGSNASVMTDELAVPRKKANRVSFDETNVVVGSAATPTSSDSPTVQSPQTKRPWYSIGRGKKKELAVTDDDDEVMKPRPALPSFGSVREKKNTREVEERPLVKPAEPVESKQSVPSPPLFTTPTGDIMEYPLGQSNDHVVGAIISQDAASKNAANISKSREPLPPQVTSVEGSGYHSDTDSSEDSLNIKSDVGVAQADTVKRSPEGGNADSYKSLASPVPEPEPEHVETEDDTPTPIPSPTLNPVEKPNGEIPEIAVVHATPTLKTTESRSGMPHMPGDWDSSDSDNQQDAPMPTTVPNYSAELKQAAIGIAETAPIIHEHDGGEMDCFNNSHATPAIIEEAEESDATSVYSDANEDFSDVEGGFLSLDAAVESPIVSHPIVNTAVPGVAVTTSPESPTPRSTKEMAFRQSQLSKESSEPDLGEGWDKAQEYWSSLSADKKRQLELDARKQAEDSGSDTEVEVKPIPKPKKKKKKPVAVVQPPAPVAPTVRAQPTMANERNYMIQPGSRAGPNGHAPMRSSMRPEPRNTGADTHMRTSMRSGDTMRGSLRGSLQKKHHPVSLPAEEIKADPAAVKKHIRNLSEASAAAAPAAAKRDLAPPPLRRRNSGDSDSSFKRTRPSTNRSNFRRSMRNSGEQNFGGRPQSPPRSSRFSLRSLSPTGSAIRRPFSSAASPVALSQTHMRSSMRRSSDSTSSLRTRMPGFGKSRGSKQTKQKAPQRTSRFADSSDEEDDRPAFRSRFNDSSDEDEPISRPIVMPRSMRSEPVDAPVRGIPKRAGAEDGDSSDLPDSDDEKPSGGLKLAKKRGTNGPAITPTQGTALASGSLRRSGSGRETISSPTTMATITGPASRPSHSRRGSFMSILRRKKPDPSSKVRKSDAESPARRDTPLERSKSDLAVLRGDRPATPKLQKRNGPSRQNSGAWPLPGPTSPPTIVGGEEGRPDTADGIVGGELTNGHRPDMGSRRFTATGLADVDINGIGKPRRKKKFGALRRIFRLDD